MAQRTGKANAEGVPAMVIEVGALVPTGGHFPRMFDSTLWADENVLFNLDLDLIRALPLRRFRLEKLAYTEHEIADKVVAISRPCVR